VRRFTAGGRERTYARASLESYGLAICAPSTLFCTLLSVDDAVAFPPQRQGHLVPEACTRLSIRLSPDRLERDPPGSAAHCDFT